MNAADSRAARGSGPAEPKVRVAGDGALLLDCGTLDHALAVFASLAAARESGELDVGELVPAAETVLVYGGEAASPRRFTMRLGKLLREHAGSAGRAGEEAETVIPVTYDGGDLEEVAQLTSMSVDQVINRHLAADYTVAFTGFAPGFAYLSGGDDALSVPRRQSPRPRIPAGSVGLAGPFSGVYPRESPGGWQLIGHTPRAMWDLDRERPAALVPGARVRFSAERGQLSIGEPQESARSAVDTEPEGGRPVLEVTEPGLQTLVEDAGRPGFAAFGVSPSGAADRGALASANRLVGNAESLPVLELGHGGFAAEVLTTSVLALAGAPRSGRIEGPFGSREVVTGRPFRVDPGERMQLDAPERGLRTVLALRGGVRAPLALGSASRDTLAGLGPEPLAAGDKVLAGDAPTTAVGLPEPPAAELPVPGEETVLSIVPGPRDDWFGEEGLRSLTETSWEVTPHSDRVGVRLAGEVLKRSADYRDRELPSEGTVTGALQVPPDGQPVLFLADRPLTGGYPVIGVVHGRDLDLAAQLPPGARVRFTTTHLSTHPSTSLSTTEENER